MDVQAFRTIPYLFISIQVIIPRPCPHSSMQQITEPVTACAILIKCIYLSGIIPTESNSTFREDSNAPFTGEEKTPLKSKAHERKKNIWL